MFSRQLLNISKRAFLNAKSVNRNSRSSSISTSSSTLQSKLKMMTTQKRWMSTEQPKKEILESEPVESMKPNDSKVDMEQVLRDLKDRVGRENKEATKSTIKEPEPIVINEKATGIFS